MIATALMRQRFLQLASALTASYIGGSINFAAVSASLATPGPQVAAAMAAGVCSPSVAITDCFGAFQLVPVSSSPLSFPNRRLCIGKAV